MVEPEDALGRFVAAQDRTDTFAQALSELHLGRKHSHWIWYVFPQIDGLGQSDMSRRYALSSLAEARDYLAHPILGPRLAEAARALLGVENRTIIEIMGPVDAQKLRSCMTLFLRADPADGVFQDVLEAYFGGEPDAATDRILADGGKHH